MSYRVDEILNLIKCPVICIVDRKEREYESGALAYNAMLEKDVVQGKNLVYELQGITTEEDKVIVSLKKKLVDLNTADSNAEWVKEHIEKYGIAPDFF